MTALAAVLLVLAAGCAISAAAMLRRAESRLRAARLIESDELYMLRRIGWAAADWATGTGASRARGLLVINKLGQAYAALLGNRRAVHREAMSDPPARIAS